jgi:hypothetical protein
MKDWLSSAAGLGASGFLIVLAYDYLTIAHPIIGIPVAAMFTTMSVEMGSKSVGS